MMIDFIYISKIGDRCQVRLESPPLLNRSYTEVLGSALLHRGVGECETLFPRLVLITLDTYLIMLSVKQ